MSAGHHCAAQQDGAALPEEPVPDDSAQDRRGGAEPGVKAEDFRGQRLAAHRAEYAFQRMPEHRKTHHILDVPAVQ